MDTENTASLAFADGLVECGSQDVTPSEFPLAEIEQPLAETSFPVDQEAVNTSENIVSASSSCQNGHCSVDAHVEGTSAHSETDAASARDSQTFSSALSSESICISIEQELHDSSCDIQDVEPSVKRRCTEQNATVMRVVAVAKTQQRPRGGRGLVLDGQKQVEGFESCGLWVAKCNKKLPKTQSWCFVPLIFSALGRVPDWLQQEGLSSVEQIEAAQPVWCRLFSHWSVWREELRKAMLAYDIDRFGFDFLPKTTGAKSWTTSLVFGEPRTFGKLPHPQGAKQDKILLMLPCEMQNQIFAAVVTIASV